MTTNTHKAEGAVNKNDSFRDDRIFGSFVMTMRFQKS